MALRVLSSDKTPPPSGSIADFRGVASRGASSWSGKGGVELHVDLGVARCESVQGIYKWSVN